MVQILFKGRYTPSRIFQLIVDLLVFLSMIGLMVSGIMLSNHVFSFLNIHGGMSFARLLHMAASHWGFVLMALHLRLHWGMFRGLTKKAPHLNQPSSIRKILLPIFGAGIAIVFADYRGTFDMGSLDSEAWLDANGIDTQ